MPQQSFGGRGGHDGSHRGGRGGFGNQWGGGGGAQQQSYLHGKVTIAGGNQGAAAFQPH